MFARAKDGTISVRSRPVRKAGFTAGELKSQSRLIKGNAYVQQVKADLEAYAAYEAAARLRGKRTCDLAKADFAHPPAITDVDLSQHTGQPGQPIYVQAVDDFEVKSVQLTFTRLDGVLIEAGPATFEAESASWRYVTEVPVACGEVVVVHVTASDHPGNQVTKTFEHALVALA